MIQFQCQSCGQNMQVADNHPHTQGRCPGCNAVVDIPLPGMSPAVAPPALVTTPQSKAQATAALVLGIVSLVIPLLSFITGILAIVFGILGMRRQAGKGMATAGLVMGAIGLVFWPIMIGMVLVPALGRARELARQAACQANLSAIGKSVVMYSGMTSDIHPFPLLRQYGNPNDPVTTSTHANGDLFVGNTNKVLGANGMQNAWVLIDQNLVGQAAFHCPSDGGWTLRLESDRFGWTSPTQFSYGVQWPYDGLDEQSPNPAKLSDSNASPSLVIFTDRNPGGSVSPNRQHSNHGADGAAILRKDSSVSFYKNTSNSFGGYGGDDIYTNADGVVGGMPKNTYDASITPGASRP